MRHARGFGGLVPGRGARTVPEAPGTHALGRDTVGGLVPGRRERSGPGRGARRARLDRDTVGSLVPGRRAGSRSARGARRPRPAVARSAPRRVRAPPRPGTAGRRGCTRSKPGASRVSHLDPMALGRYRLGADLKGRRRARARRGTVGAQVLHRRTPQGSAVLRAHGPVGRGEPPALRRDRPGPASVRGGSRSVASLTRRAASGRQAGPGATKAARNAARPQGAKRGHSPPGGRSQRCGEPVWAGRRPPEMLHGPRQPHAILRRQEAARSVAASRSGRDESRPKCRAVSGSYARSFSMPEGRSRLSGDLTSPYGPGLAPIRSGIEPYR